MPSNVLQCITVWYRIASILHQKYSQKRRQKRAERKLRSISTNFYIHVLYLREIHVYSQDRSAYLAAAKLGRPIVNCGQFYFWEYINRVFFAVRTVKRPKFDTFFGENIFFLLIFFS